jgi:hypothetical protein
LALPPANRALRLAPEGTLGWIVELTYRSIEQGVSPRFGPRLFMLGLALGLFLITVPAAFWSGYRILKWAGLAT